MLPPKIPHLASIRKAIMYLSEREGEDTDRFQKALKYATEQRLTYLKLADKMVSG